MRRSAPRRGSRPAALLLGCGLLSSGLLAAGCGSSAAQARGLASLSGIGPITFATGKLDTGSYLPALLAEWNRAHPRQRVTLIPLPDEADDQHAQMVANLQTRSSRYDVMNLDVVWTAEFAASGWIVPLSPRLFPLSHFLRPAVATARYQGRLYAVPFTSNAGLLYYRKDVLRRAGVAPPRTWAQLARDAARLGRRYHLGGYGGQFQAYEGLTVNFAEAVQSAGGSILSADGTRVTLDSPAGRAGLRFLQNGLRQGWIPRAALGWNEESSRRAFQAGRLLFLRNWSYVYGLAARSPIAGRFGVTALPGHSSLGGANLAISAYSRHQRTALAFIQFLTSLPSERQVLARGSLPPVWTRLYTAPGLVRRFPYLPVLERAILAARPRPQIPSYNQLSLAISGAIHQALVRRLPAGATIAALSRQLGTIVSGSVP